MDALTPQALDTAPVVQVRELHGKEPHANRVFRAELDDGRRVYVKPERGESPNVRELSVPPDGQWKREIAACRLDRSLGLGVVPDTVRRDGLSPLGGPASVQAEAPLRNLPREWYSNRDRQAMALLDYIGGNTDRHEQNYRTSFDGRPAAIDNGLMFPEDARHAIWSGFVADCLRQPLDSTLIASVRETNTETLRMQMEDCGLSRKATDGLIARLREVQHAGRITGEGWPGEIYDEELNIVKDAL